MTDVFATLIVTAAKQEQAQAIGAGMFTTPIGKDNVATHYISSGYLPAELLAELQGVADCYDNGPNEVMAALGMTLCDGLD